MAQGTIKKESLKAGRRAEIKVRLGQETLRRYSELFAEGDYVLIAARVTPATNRQLVSKNLKAAAADPDYRMGASLAQAAQAFYQEKEELQKSLAS